MNLYSIGGLEGPLRLSNQGAEMSQKINSKLKTALALAIALTMTSAAPALAGPMSHTMAAQVDGARIIKADQEPGNWMTTGRTYGEQRFNPLAEINTENVSKLGLAWY
jgi:quinohemoprotein ethanol dehydrogenase